MKYVGRTGCLSMLLGLLMSCSPGTCIGTDTEGLSGHFPGLYRGNNSFEHSSFALCIGGGSRESRCCYFGS